MSYWIYYSVIFSQYSMSCHRGAHGTPGWWRRSPWKDSPKNPQILQVSKTVSVSSVLCGVGSYVTFVLTGSGNSRPASLSRGRSSLNTRLAGKLSMRWRNSSESRSTETSRRPKRNWRPSWRRQKTNISSCWWDKVRDDRPFCPSSSAAWRF